MHDLQWVVTVQSGVFKLISGLQNSNSIFSKVDKMELEHYSIHPTIRVQRRMILVVDLFIFSKLSFFVLLLL